MGKVNLPFTQHLSADHQHWLSVRQSLNQVGHRFTALHRVTVDAHDGVRREALAQKRLGLLCADAGSDQSAAIAVRAVPAVRCVGRSGGNAAPPGFCALSCAHHNLGNRWSIHSHDKPLR